MLDAKTAQKWTEMARERFEEDPYIQFIVKEKIKTKEDIMNAVIKYVHKKILATAKILGEDKVTIHYSRIRKSLTANSNALSILAKDNKNTSYVYDELLKILEDKGYTFTELKSSESIIINWSND
jgi:aspartyl/asparaginyl-tRNA synthetase